tara:strand:+ start:4385 stop:4765 length:381 start_codon:yes stop_codon:yes gene_type:complete
MHPRNAADVYRTSSVENAPPIQIIRMLYEGALRFLEQASRLDPSDPKSGFPQAITRVDDIVVELRLALDKDVGPEVSENLERLYLYCEDELGRATVDRTLEPLPNVRTVLEVLLDAWQQVEVQAGR